VKLKLAPNFQRKTHLTRKTRQEQWNYFASNGRGKKEVTCKELEIIIYRAENSLPHTYTHLSLSVVLVLSKNCKITLLELI